MTSSLPPAGRNPFDQFAGKIAVGAGDLQGRAGKYLPQFRHRRIAQAGIVAPQNKVDQPLPLKKPYGLRVHIGPPVMRGEIMWCLDAASGRGSGN